MNDHDPRPLYYELMAERPGQFGWMPLEQGPEVWSARIRCLGRASEPRTPAWLREEHRALRPHIEDLFGAIKTRLPGDHLPEMLPSMA